ncbi:MAG TPA: bifunctional UDP-N-acetylglucosamine diphosphorylase/glucosamine-1-phosphate N-acetyltransferase GlmU [Mycobacteriales bacterium]|nr:bifunctional UDP-N-acetylglucosamine diphosphorylase/glucosamine-1-phosphate N-acetyltransferase GlmU [Mycobacteriales bacterium]
MANLAAVVVLAAGEGKRMRSATPKVLHEVGGRTLLGHVLHALAPLSPARTLVVVGHGRDQVMAALGAIDPGAQAVVQDEQKGTGHAVRLALEVAPDVNGTVLVVCGDTPLLRAETLDGLVTTHSGAATMLTTRLGDPTGYGRVLRDDAGTVTGIVEEKDADATQRAIEEVNGGVYAFAAGALRDALGKVSSDNAQGEEYLTDVIGLMVGAGLEVATYAVADPQEAVGVNDRVQLAVAGAVLRERAILALQRGGTTVVDPATTWVDDTVTCEPDAVIEPFTILRGTTTVAVGAVVGPYTSLTDTAVGAGARVFSATCVGAEIGPGASVGPYTYLRPGTRLGRNAKAGGFVEMKNAEVGADSKVPHLSYVGDATIGERSNIGAATVFVNYDGVEKHHTTVGDDVRVGSDTMLVAPVTIGDAAYTAAGSVITNDVPPGALGVGRARQRNIEGWVERRRSAAADAEGEQGDEQP